MHWIGVVAIVAAVATCWCAIAGSETASLLIRASASFQQLGDYRVTADPTYRGARAALGPASSCRLVGGSPSDAVATWRHLGVRIRLVTFGAVPAGRTGCTAPAAIKVSTIRVTSSLWRTARGLRVGDSLSRLRRLYPAEIPTRGVRGWYGRGYWLVTHRRACIGVCDRAFETAPVLVAEIRKTRVAAIVFVVGAQGE